MTALICGSFAFDTIMVFPDQFKNHLLADKLHILNVCFLVPDIRREFGGCAGNIAFNLKLMGGDGVPMGAVGKDFDGYARWMDETGVSRKYIKEFSDSYTAQAFITTDQDDNQITAFHPGAMSFAHETPVPVDAGISIGIVSPDGRDGMIAHAEQFLNADIPFIFDPGQGLPMFDGDDLNRFIDQASYVTVNDYEAQLLQDRTGSTLEEIASKVKALVVTLGAKGSMIYADNKVIEIPTAKVSQINDPTGCGDAFRAGLLYGLMNDMDWETTGRIASLLGAIKIEHKGTQNHSFHQDQFEARFKETFGRSI
jgi:adenosine kinase